MSYAFLDESGDETPYGGQPCLVVALLATTSPRALDLAVTRARRKYGASLASGEMKADASPRAVTMWILQALAASPVEIVATVIDKSAILRPPSDPGAIYRLAVAETARRAAQRQPQLEIFLDKRYTSPKLRQLLEQSIHNKLVGLPTEVTIHHADSIGMKGLQAADFVAWALFQKYARGVAEFYEVIAPRIVDEEVLKIALW
jgi:hypothetical protein